MTTADAYCMVCRGSVAWWDDEPHWRHVRGEPRDGHEPTPNRSAIQRAFVDATGLPSPGDPERRAEWEEAL